MELLILLVGLWALSPIGLTIALVVARRARRRAEAAAAQFEDELDLAQALPTPRDAGLGGLSPRDVTSLLLLRQELDRRLEAGEIEATDHERLSRQLGHVWGRQLAQAGLEPDTGKWRSRRHEAWTIFVRQQAEPPGPPPWHGEEAPGHRPAHEAELEKEHEAKRESEHETEHEPVRPWLSAHQTVTGPAAAGADPIAAAAAWRQEGQALRLTAAKAPKTPATVPDGTVTDAASPGAPAPSPWTDEHAAPAWGRAPREPAETPDAPPRSEPSDTGAFAFEPVVPTALGKAIEAVSGWPRLAAPFLVQNIGWFIGGFCFIAGTLFLVSVTTGYANALVILASLAIYTGFLLWAGYSMRRKSPELRTSSNVLLSTSMLLAPLNLTAGVHLVSAGVGSTPALTLALVLVACQCAGHFVAARLANALMDRSLPARHAQLFTALGALQLAAPLVAGIGHWWALVTVHAATLALLGWGMVTFAREWVRSIFLDRRLIAYYAAGLLVFAALVSFVLVARAYPAPLPRGYLGPFLMALCAMLFYLDAALKEWTKKHPFLSRFTFGLYALTIVALVACFDAPAARIVTLTLAVATYAQVLWRYSSVPALYLLLVAIGWLYGSIVLAPVAPAHHLLASVPGLAALFALMRWNERRSFALATVCLRAFGLAFLGLTSWSLYHGEPGAAAFATGTVAVAAIVYALHSAQWLLRVSVQDRSAASAVNPAPWYYVVAALAAVTLAYAPRLAWLSWSDQLAFALLGLAIVASWIALRLRAGASTVRTEAALNSAIVVLTAAILLGAQGALATFPAAPSLALLLAVAGCLLAWLSVALWARWMFYGVLAAFGVAALIVKRTYFPAPSFGTGELVGVLALWATVWWLDGRQAAAEAVGLDALARDLPPPEALRVLWTVPVSTPAAAIDGATDR